MRDEGNRERDTERSMKIIKVTIAILRFETLNLLVSRPGPHPCVLQLLGYHIFEYQILCIVFLPHIPESQGHNVSICIDTSQ